MKEIVKVQNQYLELVREAALEVITRHGLEREFCQTVWDLAEQKGVVRDLYKPTKDDIDRAWELARVALPAVPEDL